MPKKSKEKGDLLEEIVKQICSGFKNASVSKNVKIKGKSGVDRQIDVLIEATQKSFNIRIIVEAKNYSKKVAIDTVEALRTKIIDVGGNLGAIVCPKGFTKGAVDSAKLNDIQLFQVFDHKLGNTRQLVPLRYVFPYINGYAVKIQSSAFGNSFDLPNNQKKWRIYIDGNIYSIEDLIVYAWNNKMFPRQEGEQIANFGIRKIASVDDINKFYHLELTIVLRIYADYYLKLYPVSYMKNIQSGKIDHKISIDLYSKKDQMIKNGWNFFLTSAEMESVAKEYDTSEDLKNFIIIQDYKIK